MNQRILKIAKRYDKVYDFLLYAESETKKHDIIIDLHDAKKVLADSLMCSGFFDSDEKRLVCAVKKSLPIWLPIFTHEFCHFLQWRDNTVFFDKRYPRYYDTGVVDEWIAGKKISKTKIKNSIEASQACELDCEKRVVRMIRKFNLPIDIDHYIKRANTYVMFYNYVLIRRMWVPKNKPMPYNIKKLLDLFPSKFLKSYDSIPMEYLLELDRIYGTTPRT